MCAKKHMSFFTTTLWANQFARTNEFQNQTPHNPTIIE
jgi:hypothetical protein